MLDIINNRIRRSDIVDSELIKRWEVWFKTPFGLCPTREEAIKAMQEKDLNPELVIYPVPVAISETTYEIFDRG